ncbi:hypothetical protein L2E82_01622 [Cichorium intybus]|uniref:Uncharacterized protein n=1 Tax=Cichorium intybus TaxID=13427 RepID=A0ACB9GZ25_CICIN|nr:hypothetical protein L2E82_01622 [Cichorium intybus]
MCVCVFLLLGILIRIFFRVCAHGVQEVFLSSNQYTKAFILEACFGTNAALIWKRDNVRDENHTYPPPLGLRSYIEWLSNEDLMMAFEEDFAGVVEGVLKLLTHGLLF